MSLGIAESTCVEGEVAKCIAGSGDPEAVRSPYLDSLNSLAAVLGANISAGRDGEVIDLEDVVSGAARWNPESMGQSGL